VFLADGGGGGTPSGPSYSGTQTLKIEPSAIPAALKAFQTAHDRVSKKVDELSGMQVPAWAGDPVSHETATHFANRSTGGGADSAIKCLTGYRDQLKAACDSLSAAQQAYTVMEGENSAYWGKY
jgi:hypothetical protein